MMREEALEVVQFDALDQINLLIDNDMNSVSETGLHDSKEKKIECPICGITADADCTIMQPSKDILKNQEEFSDVKDKYIEEEIDIRVESLKNEIEEAGERLKEKLREMKKEVKKIDASDVEVKLECFKKNLLELQNNIKSHSNFTDNYLNESQENLRNLNEFIFKIKNSNKIPEISVSKTKLDLNMIGKINFVNRDTIESVDLIQNGKQEIFHLDATPSDILVFSNNQILTVNSKNKCLSLYDQNLKLIKRIRRIGVEMFRPSAVALNMEEEKLYILDHQHNRILMTDLEFNLIKSVGSRGIENEHFRCPNDLCLINNNLYVCDTDNYRIQVFSKDLEFIKSEKVIDKPWKIKASSHSLIIQSVRCRIFFYDLNDFNLLQKYYHGRCRISKINSNIYAINHKEKFMFCYDEKGNLKEKVHLTSINEYLTNDLDGSFIEFNGTLLMLSQSRNRIIKFSNN